MKNSEVRLIELEFSSLDVNSIFEKISVDKLNQYLAKVLRNRARKGKSAKQFYLNDEKYLHVNSCVNLFELENIYT